MMIYSDAEFFGDRSGRWHVLEFDLLSLIRTNFIDACAPFRKTLCEEVGGYDEYKPFGTFFHLPEIGFDYSVRSDSIIVKMIGFDYRMQRDYPNVARISPRVAELINHIFAKPELAC